MNARFIVSAALVAAAVIYQPAQAQQPEIQRTDLVKEDISVAGKEVVQVRVASIPAPSQ